MRWNSGIALICLIFLPVFAMPAESEQSISADTVARYISGLPVEEEALPPALRNLPDFRAQRAFFESRWSELEPRRLDPMRKWASGELEQARNDTETLFYPFGGPDFLHAFTFFPNANRYIHFGLEPAGIMPDLQTMNKKETSDMLTLIRKSLFAVLEWSFFRTNDMKVDLIRSRMGAAPLILSFIARSGNEVLKVDYVELDADGNLVTVDATSGKPVYAGPVPGIRVFFRKSEDAAPQEVIYFSLDVSDSAYGQNKRLHSFIKKQRGLVTYLKAASYLMHYASFNQIRGLILEESQHILQTDSGIPYGYFSKANWDITLYGVYTRPIPLFRNRYQADLRSAYLKSAQPLPFGIGYNYREGTSNLMLASKKK
ncbi:MAG: hypothetical protein KDK23_01400 [Leptospiraceae bacterium]|nr:hypothetical protein [Leptospiraceae bacterium]